jgi:hypothetical protein
MLISTKYNCFKGKFYKFLNLLNTFNYKEFIIFQTHNSCNSVLKCQTDISLTTTSLMAVIVTITSKQKCMLSTHLTFVPWHPIFWAYLLRFPPPLHIYINVYQRTCIKHQAQAQDNKVFNMLLLKSGSSVKNLCYVTFLQPRIWRGFLDICKICGRVIKQQFNTQLT